MEANETGESAQAVMITSLVDVRRWRCSASVFASLVLAVTLLVTPAHLAAQDDAHGDTTSGVELHYRLSRRPANGSVMRGAVGAELVARGQGTLLRLDARRMRGDSQPSVWMLRGPDSEGWQLFDRDRRSATVVHFPAIVRILTDDAESEVDVLQQEAELRGPGDSVGGAPTISVRIRRAVSVQSFGTFERASMRINSVSDVLIDTTRQAPEALEEGLAVLSGSLIDLVFAAGLGNVELREGGRVPRGLLVQAVTFTEEETIGAQVTGGDDITRVTWLDTLQFTGRSARRHRTKLFEPPAGFKRLALPVAVQRGGTWVPDALRAPPSAPPRRAMRKRPRAGEA